MSERPNERFCKSLSRIPKGFRLKALGCESPSYPGEVIQKNRQPQRGCGHPASREFCELILGLIEAATPLGLFRFAAGTQGSSLTRNPGLDAAIPLGLLAGESKLK